MCAAGAVVDVDEFALIDRYFRVLGAVREDVGLGVGDDAAVVVPAPARHLVLTTDTLVAGRHFPSGDFPSAALGHRCLAVNLSDLAAMGAEPAWALLSLTLPTEDDAWLAGFAQGFDALARRMGVALVGGNVARGPLNVTVTLAGQIEPDAVMKRSGACAGDGLWVTGALGGGSAGLRAWREGSDIGTEPVAAYACPEPRVSAGRLLARHAHAGMDVSDGLIGDLAKMLAASGRLGAELGSAALPLAPGATLDDALGPSDDYELLLSLPAACNVASLAAKLNCGLHCIGRVTGDGRISVDGRPMDVETRGYRHFR